MYCGVAPVQVAVVRYTSHMPSEEHVWGLDQETYDRLASQHSKANIFLWVVSGLLYLYWIGELVSLATLLLLLPGIFIASFASMPTFWVNVKKMQIVPKTHNVLVLLGFTVWYVVDLIYPVVLALLFIELVRVVF